VQDPEAVEHVIPARIRIAQGEQLPVSDMQLVAPGVDGPSTVSRTSACRSSLRPGPVGQPFSQIRIGTSGPMPATGRASSRKPHSNQSTAPSKRSRSNRGPNTSGYMSNPELYPNVVDPRPDGGSDVPSKLSNRLAAG
jgi:hypothetical protein